MKVSRSMSALPFFTESFFTQPFFTEEAFHSFLLDTRNHVVALLVYSLVTFSNPFTFTLHTSSLTLISPNSEAQAVIVIRYWPTLMIQ
jgi:hypothetical protein